MEREQEKFSGEWAGTTRPSNQSLDYSAVRVCLHTRSTFVPVSLAPLPLLSFSSLPFSSSVLLSSSRPNNTNHHSSSFPILYDYYTYSSPPPSVLLLLLLLRAFLLYSPCLLIPLLVPSVVAAAAASRLSPVRVLASLPPLLSPLVLFFFFPRHFCLRHGFLLVDEEPRGQIGFLRCSRADCVRKYRPCRSPWLMNLPAASCVSRPAAGSPRVLASVRSSVRHHSIRCNFNVPRRNPFLSFLLLFTFYQN